MTSLLMILFLLFYSDVLAVETDGNTKHSALPANIMHDYLLASSFSCLLVLRTLRFTALHCTLLPPPTRTF